MFSWIEMLFHDHAFEYVKKGLKNSVVKRLDCRFFCGRKITVGN